MFPRFARTTVAMLQRRVSPLQARMVAMTGLASGIYVNLSHACVRMRMFNLRLRGLYANADFESTHPCSSLVCGFDTGLALF